MTGEREMANSKDYGKGYEDGMRDGAEGGRVTTKRTVKVYTSGGDDRTWIGDTVEEAEALCSVELGESAPAEKGTVYVKSVKAFGYTVREAGDAAKAEIDRLRGLRDGRVSVSRETAAAVYATLNGPGAEKGWPGDPAMQELRTVLSFGVKPGAGPATP